MTHGLAHTLVGKDGTFDTIHITHYHLAIVKNNDCFVWLIWHKMWVFLLWISYDMCQVDRIKSIFFSTRFDDIWWSLGTIGPITLERGGGKGSCPCVFEAFEHRRSTMICIGNILEWFQWKMFLENDIGIRSLKDLTFFPNQRGWWA